MAQRMREQTDATRWKRPIGVPIEAGRPAPELALVLGVDSARLFPELQSIACGTLRVKRACNDHSIIIGFRLELLAGGDAAIGLQENTAIFVHA